MARRVKPQSLRPLSRRHRTWFWGLIGLGVIVIIIGWMITLKDVLNTQAPEIVQTVEERVETAAQQIGETGGEVVDEVEDEAATISETLEAIKTGYEAEKARQEQEEATQTEIQTP